MITINILRYLTNNRRIKLVITHEKPEAEIDISVVIPVYNQENLIINNLESIMRSMGSRYEIVLINDKSTDYTEKRILDFLSTNPLEKYSNCSKFRYYKSDFPMYETKCDEYGISQSLGELVIEIQADMEIIEKGFDLRLKNAINSDPSIWAISGRATHSFRDISSHFLEKQSKNNLLLSEVLSQYWRQLKAMAYKESLRLRRNHQDFENFPQQAATTKIDETFESRGAAGWIGELIDDIPTDTSVFRERTRTREIDRLWIGDSVIRGPLIIKKQLYLQLGGFDIQAFFLGNDDHDLCLRGKKAGLKVGFFPVHFVAPLRFGSERKRKTLLNLIWKEVHRFARRKNLVNTELYRGLITENGKHMENFQAKVIEIQDNL